MSLLLMASCGTTAQEPISQAEVARSTSIPLTFSRLDATFAGHQSFLLAGERDDAAAAVSVVTVGQTAAARLLNIPSDGETPPQAIEDAADDWLVLARGCDESQTADCSARYQLLRLPTAAQKYEVVADLADWPGALELVGISGPAAVIVADDEGSSRVLTVDTATGSVRELAWHPTDVDAASARAAAADATEQSSDEEAPVSVDIPRTRYCVAEEQMWAFTAPALSGAPNNKPDQVALVDLASGQALAEGELARLSSRLFDRIACEPNRATQFAIREGVWSSADVSVNNGLFVESDAVSHRFLPEGEEAVITDGHDGRFVLGAVKPGSFAAPFTTVDPLHPMATNAPSVPDLDGWLVDPFGVATHLPTPVAHDARLDATTDGRWYLMASATAVTIHKLPK